MASDLAGGKRLARKKPPTAGMTFIRRFKPVIAKEGV